MEAKKNFSILRKLLGAIGLSPEATDDIIERITDFLSDRGDMSGWEADAGFLPTKSKSIPQSFKS